MATCAGNAPTAEYIRSPESNHFPMPRIDELFFALDEGARFVFYQLMHQVLEEARTGEFPGLGIMLSCLARMSAAERYQCLDYLGHKTPVLSPNRMSPPSSPDGAKVGKSRTCNRDTGVAVGASPGKRALWASSPVPPPGLAGSASPVRGSIAQTLAQLASFSPESQTAIGRAGGISTLVQILREGPREERPKAVGAILNLVQGNPANQAALVACEGIVALVAMTRERPAADEVCGVIARILSTLVKTDKAHASSIASAGGIAMLVRLVRQGSSVSCGLAVFSLRHLALSSTDAKLLIAQEGGIAPLIWLLQEGSLESRGYAAGALAALADGCSNNQAAIAVSGGIIPLVLLLKEGAVDACRRAALALMHVALHSQEHQLLIAQAGAIPALVRLARSDGLGLRLTEAIEALAAVAKSCPDNQALVLASGGASILVDRAHRGAH